MFRERHGVLREGAEVFGFRDEGRHISGGAFADRASCKPSPQNANRNKPAERELRRLGNSVVLAVTKMGTLFGLLWETTTT
jgi:hypothetical protein